MSDTNTIEVDLIVSLKFITNATLNPGIIADAIITTRIQITTIVGSTPKLEIVLL